MIPAEVPDGYEVVQSDVCTSIGPGYIKQLACSACGNIVGWKQDLIDKHDEFCAAKNYVCRSCFTLVPKRDKERHENEEKLRHKNSVNTSGWSSSALGRLR